MEVEAYECHETASEPLEASEEAMALIEQLGLTGQKELVTKREDGRDMRCPYREMTADEQYVYKVLCPEEFEVAKYNRGPMPLRVLQIAAHANALGIFEKIIVWDRASATIKDPVLIGMKKHPQWSWQQVPFILARWGEELEAFVVLAKRAYQQKRDELLDCVQRSRSMIETEAARINAMTDDDLRELGAAAKVKVTVG